MCSSFYTFLALRKMGDSILIRGICIKILTFVHNLKWTAAYVKELCFLINKLEARGDSFLIIARNLEEYYNIDFTNS